jgi:hypothetical protein
VTGVATADGHREIAHPGLLAPRAILPVLPHIGRLWILTMFVSVGFGGVNLFTAFFALPLVWSLGPLAAQVGHRLGARVQVARVLLAILPVQAAAVFLAPGQVTRFTALSVAATSIAVGLLCSVGRTLGRDTTFDRRWTRPLVLAGIAACAALVAVATAEENRVDADLVLGATARASNPVAQAALGTAQTALGVALLLVAWAWARNRKWIELWVADNP